MFPAGNTNKFDNHNSFANSLSSPAQSFHDISSLTKDTTYEKQEIINHKRTNATSNTNSSNRFHKLYTLGSAEIDLTKGVPTPQASPMMEAWHSSTPSNDCSNTSKPTSQCNPKRKRSSVYDLSTILNDAYNKDHSLPPDSSLLNCSEKNPKLDQSVDNVLEEQEAKRCCCKQANKKKIIVKPQNPFILFRHNFQKLLTKYITLEHEYLQEQKRNAGKKFFVELDSTKNFFTSQELERCCFKNLFELDIISHECLYANVNFASKTDEKSNISSPLRKKRRNHETSPYTPRVKVSKISQFASKKWLGILPKTKLYWKTQANDAKKEYELKHGYFGNGHRVKKVDASMLKNNRLSERKNQVTEKTTLNDNATAQDRFELCSFCKKQLELNPNVTRSTNWNQVYYEVKNTTIDIKEIMERNNVPSNLGLSLQNYDSTERFVFMSNRAPTDNQIIRRNAVAEHEILQNTHKQGYTFVNVSNTFLGTESELHETFTKKEMEGSILTDYLNGIRMPHESQDL